MNAAHVSVTSADPEELTSELAIATADFDGPPAALRVNGMSLTPQICEPDWQDAPQVWRLTAGQDDWSMIAYAREEWQVLDIFRCIDIAEQIDVGATADEVFVMPLASGWAVVHADPTGNRELVLQAIADEASIWRTRNGACAAAQRFAEGRATRGPATA